MTIHSTDAVAISEGQAQARALVVPRPRRSNCRVHVLVTPNAKRDRRELKKAQLELSFRQQYTSLNDNLSPAMVAYLNGVND